MANEVEMQTETKYLFIVGAGHSGSTLLNFILGNHSCVTSVGEIVNWDKYIARNSYCSCGSYVRDCSLWSCVLTSWVEHTSERPVESNSTDTRSDSIADFRNRLLQRISIVLMLLIPNKILLKLPVSTFTALNQISGNILDLFSFIHNTTGKPLICDSSKSVFRFRLIFWHQPNSTKAIYLTRDGRAVTASAFKRLARDPVKTAKKWRFNNLYIQLMLKGIPENNKLQVRYEEICRHPEETLKRICDFADLPFEPAMLVFDHTQQHHIGGNRMRMEGVRNIKEDLKWKSILSEDQLRKFDLIAGKLNKRLMGSYFR